VQKTPVGVSRMVNIAMVKKKHSEYRSISKKSIDGHSQIAVIFFPEAKSSWKYG
jgi:hypothetical protein